MIRYLPIFLTIMVVTGAAAKAEDPRCYWNRADGTFHCSDIQQYSDNTDPYGGYRPNSQEGQRFFWDNLGR